MKRKGCLLVLLLVAIGLHAQENATDRFWYGTDPATVSRFFPDDRTATPAGIVILEEPVVILKRETPFARIERTGEVVLLGTRKGRLVIEGGKLTILRDGKELGSIAPDGSVWRGARTIGKADTDGYLYDAEEEYRGSFSGESIWIDGWVWGSASPLATPEDYGAVAAFLFFFTELPAVWSE